MTGSPDDTLIDQAIARTRAFFVQMGLAVTLADYQLGDAAIDAVCAQLEKHRLTRLGERRDVSPQMVRAVLEHCR